MQRLNQICCMERKRKTSFIEDEVLEKEGGALPLYLFKRFEFLFRIYFYIIYYFPFQDSNVFGGI